MGLVSESSIDPSAASKSLNSLCKLAEQLGTHSGGTLGWRADWGSGGTLGGATEGGAEGGKLAAHPLKIISGHSAISARLFQFRLSIGAHLCQSVLPPLLHRAHGPLGQAPAFLLHCTVVREVALRLGRLRFGHADARLLEPEGNQQAGDEDPFPVGQEEGDQGGASSTSGRSTVCPASAWVQSPRNWMRPSVT